MASASVSGFEAGYSRASSSTTANRRLRTPPWSKTLPAPAQYLRLHLLFLSVVGALGGMQTVSIDRPLQKIAGPRPGREFWRSTASHGMVHQFFADDVLEMLPRLAGAGTLCCIILDPPTFSREATEGRRFQCRAELRALLVAGNGSPAPQARILLSTNCARLDRARTGTDGAPEPETLPAIRRFSL